MQRTPEDVVGAPGARRVSHFSTFWRGIDPTLPTAAKAGSAEKIAVLMARRKARLPLFHPQDGILMVDVETEEPWWWRLWPDLESLDDPEGDADERDEALCEQHMQRLAAEAEQARAEQAREDLEGGELPE